ncbi:DMT family transporter [Clostridium swellfunianum]|uniref:DMT family transporter n=1 Tax=Clostridium swellfunianum TaxID=1367462 RepID=UPI0020304E28|nr:DMT family transporter [Clostridium swellfunianum]
MINLKKGYIYSIVSAILFGSAGLIVKLAYVEGIDAIGLLTLQYIIAVALMFLILFVKSKEDLKVTKKELFRLLVLGVVGNSCMTVFYYSAYSYLPMAMVTILLYTYPIMVFLYTLFFRKGEISRMKTLALVTAFVGCVLALGLLSGGLKYSFKGIIFGILSAVFYAFMNIYSEDKLQNVKPLAINAYSTLFSLISLVVYSFPTFIIKGQVSLNLLGYTAILAVFCEIIPLTLMYAAIKHIGSLKVSIIGNIETPTAMLLSFFVLRENISFTQIVGAVLVFYAVYLIRR